MVDRHEVSDPVPRGGIHQRVPVPLQEVLEALPDQGCAHSVSCLLAAREHLPGHYADLCSDLGRERVAEVVAFPIASTPLKKLQNRQTHDSADYVRTEWLVQWLVDNSSERVRIERLAARLSEVGAVVLDKAVRDSGGTKAARQRVQRRLGDHFWCDVLAALVVALQEVDGLKDKLAESLEDVSSELATHVWRARSRAPLRTAGVPPLGRAGRPARRPTGGLGWLRRSSAPQWRTPCAAWSRRSLGRPWVWIKSSSTVAS
ncbi:hypothetical protein ACWKWA_00990 [Dermacoccus abyssi]